MDPQFFRKTDERAEPQERRGFIFTKNESNKLEKQTRRNWNFVKARVSSCFLQFVLL